MPIMLTYKSKRGKTIVFDDFTEDDEYNNVWVEMCKHHHNMYKGILGNRCDDGGTACGTCSVYGCDREADYYVDFDINEVTKD